MLPQTNIFTHLSSLSLYNITMEVFQARHAQEFKNSYCCYNTFFFFLWDWDEFLVMCFRHNSNVIVMVSWQGKLQDLQT